MTKVARKQPASSPNVNLAKPPKGEYDTCLECGKRYVNYGEGMLCEECKKNLKNCSLMIH